MAAMALLASPAAAQDASFGCKVLLCAAASNPSWGGIPYCVPPMTQLFKDLAMGKPWPVCSEGNASAPGYEPYEPCPAGKVSVRQNEEGHLITDEQGGHCTALVAETDRRFTELNCEAGHACIDPNALERRSWRPKPYYVDLSYGGQTKRFWFSLSGAN
ncbi:hypothetical protein FS320_17305 [Microvirga tunisiensis]|uniref:Uncharacterized protein n=1 Tax=Microvirga tunisiensis TaxID=2108360 RepID=A0A5N7MJ08_9HYPH|nr:hypothetical protein [Microvirga tunisiensis]MPR26927.1 hypothetical protein [Microvirga tunisiensis]